ncbi:MAG: NTP transferase domain-containing protein [Chloroflexi bacterium]|nr:NTP transferase domain-containing protein [Chloroflexota bacterium]
MQIIIPLAGLGSRLRPLTFTTPKPLVAVAGKTVLGHVLDSLDGVAIDDIVFIVGYLGDQIEKYVKEHFPHYRAHFVEQKELNGQSPAIALTRQIINRDVLILFGDSVIESDMAGLEDADADGVIFTKQVEDPRRFGVVKMQGDAIARFVEKPREFVSNQAVGGAYYLKDSRRLFAAIDEQVARGVSLKNEYYLADALQIMVEHGARLITRQLRSWYDCGTAQSLLDSNRYLLSKTVTNGHDVPGCSIITPVSIAPSAQLSNSIIGPHVSIGENVVIKDSRVGPFVSIADGCQISQSIIKDSILNQNSQIEDAMLASSLIGNDAHVKGTFDRLTVGDMSEVDSSYVEET